MLLALAIFGLIVPNGLFIYYMLFEFTGFSDFYASTLAVVFMVEAFILLGLFSYFIAKKPDSPLKWYWFVVFSLVGSLAFSVPLFLWLQKKNNASVEIF